MKKKLLLLILPLLALTLGACSKDDDRDVIDPGANTMTFNGKTHIMGPGYMHYSGATRFADRSEQLYLTLYSEDGVYIAYFIMFVPRGNTKLVSGDYKYAYGDRFGEYEIAYGATGTREELDNNRGLAITSGTITVKASGNTYTITMDCTAEGPTKFTGTYQGPLAWVDES